jgi:hypothetical protein
MQHGELSDRLRLIPSCLSSFSASSLWRSFAFIFDAPPMVVFGVLIIGVLTAFIETKLHNKNGGP